ncbi:type II CAAX endopeptidase family protein [uncultured Psychroserpens sp.]|uniref:CPBP family intramembrane glutamic endopeptidase n=1 Tax=uncultured Psychroserpens sp. TaxID=255436 RepID=UPI002619DF76|nr:type II CAAX endopeptidase family protein [uncultured Psychroserpens sp.]
MKSLKYVLATLLFIVFLELISYGFSQLFFKAFEDLAIKYYKFIFPIATALELIAIFILLLLIYKKKLLIFFKVPKRYAFIAIALGASFVFIQTPLNDIYNALFNTNINIVYDFDVANIDFYMLISTVIFIPLAEELFFRGYIQEGLNRHIKPKLAILISSLLFSLIHLQLVALFFPESELLHLDFHLTYITFFGGLISALLYYKSKSFVPSILFHMSWNFWVTLA